MNNLVLRCPKCGNSMNYKPADNKLNKSKKKRCVYCGRTFSVTDYISRRD